MYADRTLLYDGGRQKIPGTMAPWIERGADRLIVASNNFEHLPHVERSRGKSTRAVGLDWTKRYAGSIRIACMRSTLLRQFLLLQMSCSYVVNLDGAVQSRPSLVQQSL